MPRLHARVFDKHEFLLPEFLLPGGVEEAARLVAAVHTAGGVVYNVALVRVCLLNASLASFTPER